jgi:hypothetical protein
MNIADVTVSDQCFPKIDLWIIYVRTNHPNGPQRKILKFLNVQLGPGISKRNSKPRQEKLGLVNCDLNVPI